MNRRSFSRVAALGGLGVGSAMAEGVTKQAETEKPDAAAAETAVDGAADAAANAGLNLKFGPHPGMFRNLGGEDEIAQIEFSRSQGFLAWEDNGLMGKPPEHQQRVGDKLRELGMTMGVFVTYANFEESKWVEKANGFETELRDLCKRAVDCAGRCGAKWTTIVPGISFERVRPGYAFWNVVELLRVVAEEFAPSGLVTVLEPLNPMDHPQVWLKTIPDGYALCKAVDRPEVKLLADLYHQQITEGDLIRNLDRAWDEIPYIQVGDNPGRNEPTTGEINYQHIFQHLKDKGFTGVVGMEHGPWGKNVDAAREQKIIDAYRAVNPK